MSILNASQCILKVREKYGRASTKAVVNFSLIILNNLKVILAQEDCPAFMQYVIGAIIILKWGINHL